MRRQHGPGRRFRGAGCFIRANSSPSLRQPHHLDIGALSPRQLRHRRCDRCLCPRGSQFKAIKVYAGGIRKMRCGIAARAISAFPISSSVNGGAYRRCAASAPSGSRHVERYGIPALYRRGASGDVQYAERLMRQAIARAAGWRLSCRDDDRRICRQLRPGEASPAESSPTVRVRGDRAGIDLTGTADQVPDRPSTCRSGARRRCRGMAYVRSVLLDTAVCGHIPVNDGLLRPITGYRASGSARQARSSGTDDRPVLPRPISRPTRS